MRRLRYTARVIKIANIQDLSPGKMKCVRVEGRRILLANVDGRYYATDDTCTHEDASLATGSLKGDRVKCPLHGSRFDLRTGAALDEPAHIPLRTYALHIDGSDILIDLNARPSS